MKFKKNENSAVVNAGKIIGNLAENNIGNMTANLYFSDLEGKTPDAGKKNERTDSGGIYLPKILISHASEDRAYARAVAYLLDRIGIPEKAIVCSSVPEYAIPEGEKIYGWLGRQFRTTDLCVMFLLSHNYYKKAACLNEMGAAWIMQSKHNVILLPGFAVTDIKGCIDQTEIATVLDGSEEELKHRLGEIKDQLTEWFCLEAISQTKWERCREEFIEKINDLKEAE